MKTIWRLSLLASAFLFLGTATAQYAIDWYTIDGGGGTSTGGVYSVSGTMGQPDAGEAMIGGLYELTGGFWAVYAVPTPGAPFLSIVVSGSNEVTISWEPDQSGWVLQAAGVLEFDMLWTNAPSGPTNPIVVPVTQPTTFYRLTRP